MTRTDASLRAACACPPGPSVADAEIALQRDGGDVVLVRGDQVDHVEPLSQRQLGGVTQGAGAEGVLRAALRALPVLAPVGEETRVLAGAALRTDAAVWPPRQRPLALGFGAVLLDEFAQRHTLLKLDRVLGHRRRTAGGLTDHYAPRASSDREPAS